MPSNEEIKACVNGIQTIKALRLRLSHFVDNTRANGIQTIKALRLRLSHFADNTRANDIHTIKALRLHPMPAPFFLVISCR